MTWTYGNSPSSSNRDAVRFETGDTDTTDQQVTDEEISYALTTYGTVLSAAASIARGIAAKYARKVNKAVGDLRLDYSDRFRHYQALAVALSGRAGQTGVQVYAGGISVSDKDTVDEDTDRVLPGFRRGEMDNPSVGSDDNPRRSRFD